MLRKIIGTALLSMALMQVDSGAALTVLNRGNGAEPKSLDPDFVDLIPESNILGDLLLGLTTLDAGANVIPGAASSWDVSSDGRTWTFHLRKHLWSDGTPVVAEDFVFAWQRLLDPKTGAYYAYNLWVIKNAHAISKGEKPPAALDVRAIDDQTLRVELEHPATYLPQLLVHDTAYPLPRAVVLAKGNQWSRPGNFVANGAYVPEEWVANDHITLIKNPRFYDAANVRIDVVKYLPTQDTAAALARYRAGQLDTQTPLLLTQLDWIRANLKGELHSVPFLGLSYIDINEQRPPFNDVRVREALNLAYDRETMTQKVLRFGEPPAYALVPPNIANFPGGVTMDFVHLPYAERVRKAQALMMAAGYGPDHRLRAAFETSPEPDNRRLAAVLQSMWKQIFVDLDISLADENAHFRNLQQGQFELASASWFADFNDASNFLDLLRHDSGNNNGKYTSPKFEAVLEQAQQERDSERRGALLASAERIALDDYPWVPARYRMTQDLVKPYVKGWIENNRQANRTRWLSIAH